MKRLLVCFLICVITLASFVVPSFAVDLPSKVPYRSSWDISSITSDGLLYAKSDDDNIYFGLRTADFDLFLFFVGTKAYFVSETDITYQVSEFLASPSGSVVNTSFRNRTRNSTYSLYYYSPSSVSLTPMVAVYPSINEGLAAVRDYIDNPPSQITKNAHVDEFLANTLISMGVKFESGSDALSVASSAWTWCIDESYADTENRTYYDWSVDTFASYCNAQSNNYLNWYQGYKVHNDVTNALGEYIRRNFLQGSGGSLADGVPGTLSGVTVTFNRLYSPAAKGSSGGSNEFYPASTITYVNGEYITSEGITVSQFLFTPSDVRHYLGSPSAPAVTAPDSSGSGTVTDGNGDKVYDIDIDFPSLDWLADALQSLLNFLRELIDTVSNLISKVIDTLERLFSDAFESLSEFGQGFLDFIQNFFSSFSGLGSKYIPTDLWTIIVTFIALNIGIGLLLFVLRGH